MGGRFEEFEEKMARKELTSGLYVVVNFRRFYWERCVVDRSFAMITTLLMPLPAQREQRGGVQSGWGLAALATKGP